MDYIADYTHETERTHRSHVILESLEERRQMQKPFEKKKERWITNSSDRIPTLLVKTQHHWQKRKPMRYTYVSESVEQ